MVSVYGVQIFSRSVLVQIPTGSGQLFTLNWTLGVNASVNSCCFFPSLHGSVWLTVQLSRVHPVLTQWLLGLAPDPPRRWMNESPLVILQCVTQVHWSGNSHEWFIAGKCVICSFKIVVFSCCFFLKKNTLVQFRTLESNIFICVSDRSKIQTAPVQCCVSPSSSHPLASLHSSPPWWGLCLYTDWPHTPDAFPSWTGYLFRLQSGAPDTFHKHNHLFLIWHSRLKG